MTFLLKNWKYGLALLLALGIFTAAILWIKKHDNGIREAERTACDSEWSLKNTEAQAEFDKKINEVKIRQKTIRSTAKPTSQRELISILQAGQF